MEYVWILIEPGNFGDMEAFGGVFATLEGAQAHFESQWYASEFDEDTDTYEPMVFPGWRTFSVGDGEVWYTVDVNSGSYPSRGSDCIIHRAKVGA